MHCPATMPASLILLVQPVLVFISELMDIALAFLAHDKRLSFSDSENRDEKQADIMVSSFKIRLGQTAYRTQPGLVIQRLYFWRNSGN